MAKLSVLDKIAQSRRAQIALFASYFVICFLPTGYLFFLEPELVIGVATWPWLLAALREAVLWFLAATVGLTILSYFSVYKLLRTDWYTALKATVHVSSLNFVLIANSAILVLSLLFLTAKSGLWLLFDSDHMLVFWAVFIVLMFAFPILFFGVPLSVSPVLCRLSARVLQTYRTSVTDLAVGNALGMVTTLELFVAIAALIWRCGVFYGL